MKKKLKGIIPFFLIIIYGVILIFLDIWWMQYYMKPLALDFGFLYYIPYCLGGACLSCFFLARLIFRIRFKERRRGRLLYLLFLGFIVYLSRLYAASILDTYPDYFRAFTEGISKWYYGLTYHDNALILLESLIGFGVGEIYQNRKNNNRLSKSDNILIKP